MGTPLEGQPLIVHAIDLVIADLQNREYADREDQLALLQTRRARLMAESSGDG